MLFSQVRQQVSAVFCVRPVLCGSLTLVRWSYIPARLSSSIFADVVDHILADVVDHILTDVGALAVRPAHLSPRPITSSDFAAMSTSAEAHSGSQYRGVGVRCTCKACRAKFAARIGLSGGV